MDLVLEAENHFTYGGERYRIIWIQNCWYRYSVLWIRDILVWRIRIWSCHLMQKWLQPPACSDHDLHRTLSGVLSLHENIRLSAALFWFGLRNDGILYWRAAIQRTIDISPAFLEHGGQRKRGEKDRGLSTCKPWTEQAGWLEAFLHPRQMKL